MRYKEKGEAAGVAGRKFEAGRGRYHALTCGGCPRPDAGLSSYHAQQKGWGRRGEWGWLCPACLVRLELRLTPSQQLILTHAPPGWFAADDLRVYVRGALLLCQGLTRLGYLEARTTGKLPRATARWEWPQDPPADAKTEYRKLPAPPIENSY